MPIQFIKNISSSKCMVRRQTISYLVYTTSMTKDNMSICITFNYSIIKIHHSMYSWFWVTPYEQNSYLLWTYNTWTYLHICRAQQWFYEIRKLNACDAIRDKPFPNHVCALLAFKFVLFKYLIQGRIWFLNRMILVETSSNGFQAPCNVHKST